MTKKTIQECMTLKKSATVGTFLTYVDKIIVKKCKRPDLGIVAYEDVLNFLPGTRDMIISLILLLIREQRFDEAITYVNVLKNGAN